MASGGSGRRGRREHRHGHHASRGGHRGAVMHVAPVVLATVLLCGVGVASAGDVSLLVSPGPAGGDASLWVAPRHFNHTLLGPVRTPAHGLVGPSPKAAAAGSAAHWMAAQWNSPSPLPLEASPSAARQCTGGGDGRKVAWAVADAAHRLCYYTPAEAGGARAVELAQAGAQVPCGEEFDFFLSPVSPIYHNALSSVGIAASPPLSHLAALRLSFGATWREAAVTARCGTPPQCGGSGAVDYGYTVAGVVFNNEAAKQTLFWQMYLGDTRNASECPHGGRDPCASNRHWYFPTGPSFGVSDSAGSFPNGNCTRPGGGRAANDVDILTAVASALRSRTGGIDANLSNWRSGGLYVGAGLQGSVTQTLVVDSVQFSYSPREA